MNKPIIYQMLPRLWGNNTENPVRNMTVGDYLDLFISQLKDENRLGYAESFRGLRS